MVNVIVLAYLNFPSLYFCGLCAHMCVINTKEIEIKFISDVWSIVRLGTYGGISKLKNKIRGIFGECE